MDILKVGKAFMSKTSAFRMEFTSLIIVSLIISATILIPNGLSASGDKPAIVLEPSIIKDSTITPGTLFTVTVKLYNATADIVPNGLQGVEIHLTWDNSLIEPVSFVNMIGQSGGVLNPTVLYGLDPGFYDELGNKLTSPPYTNAKYYKVAGASTGNPWYGSTGTIATITFKAIAVGKCAISFKFTDLVDSLIVSIDHYVKGGCFDNRLTVPTAQVYINPEKVVDSSLTPSNSFTIDVHIKNVQYLATFIMKMSFDPAILEITDADWAWPATPPNIDNGAGVLSGSLNLAVPFSGETTLLTVQCHVKDIGESVFHLYDLQLMDMCNTSIPFTAKDGYFNNVLITRLFVDPAYRMDPDLMPGATTVFSIKGENLIQITSIEFDLLYDPNVIKIIGYYVNPIPGYLIDSEVTINNKLGRIHSCINYSQPLTLNRDTIMNITFQIVGFGVSVLDLNNTVILDSLGNPVTHQSEDGMLVTVIRDIAVIEILPVPQRVYPGRTVTIHVTVCNLGNISESFTVSLYIDGELLGEATVSDLLPSANSTVTFTWDTSGLPWCVWHSVSANVTIIPYEINTSNNFLELIQGIKIKIFGDINGDGAVSLSDLILFAQSYKKTIGDPLYNPDADIDGNGVVSLGDLVTIARYYGTSC